MLLHFGYRVKILNTINFKKSMRYNYKYTSDFDKRNELDIERFLSHRLRLKPDQPCEVYEANPSGSTA